MEKENVVALICIILGLWVQFSYSQGPTTHVSSVAQRKAILPCDISPPTFTDSTVLVLWYKDLGDMPIYSYDVRSSPGNHAKTRYGLGERAYFRTLGQPAFLTIDNVQDSDAGLYRCRVDFLKSPTRNSQVNLTVIVPPKKPKIFDGAGRELSGTAGPYNEGDTVMLTCIASGGFPAPKVTWWKNAHLIDDSYKIISKDGASQNTLMLKHLLRENLHAVYVCQASNNNISQPLSSSVQLDMHFRPLDVNLLGSNQPVSSGSEIDIVCQSVGSRPPAQITWYKDGILLKSSRIEISSDGNVSTSTLRFSGSHTDDGKSLTCRAQNSKVDASALEDSWKLRIYYVPILKLSLGSKLNANNVREGSDVYFECSIKSNPWVYKVAWLHNGIKVLHNVTAGIIMSNQSLVLQKVKKSSKGSYVCTATNIEGKGRSNPVYLKLLYKPSCKSTTSQVYGIAVGESASLICPIDANPPGDEFYWNFSNSSSTGVSSSLGSQSPGKITSSNFLPYRPLSSNDFGELSCWAKNIVGTQGKPCFVNVRPAGRPEPPVNCTTTTITSNAIGISCISGFDGGLPQTFYMEVVDHDTPQLLSNQSSPYPTFIVQNLRDGQLIRAFIYSANAKGVSKRQVIRAQTIMREALLKSGEDGGALSIVGILLGMLFTSIILSVVFMVILWGCRKKDPYLRRSLNSKQGADSGDKDESSNEDKNPDIIPSNQNDAQNEGNGPSNQLHKDFHQNVFNTEQRCTNRTENHGSRAHQYTLDRGRSPELNAYHPYTPQEDVQTSNVSRLNYEKNNSSISQKGLNSFQNNQTSTSKVIDSIGDSHSCVATLKQKEVISVKTPFLINTQQESCV